MSYDTSFTGEVDISPPLTPAQVAYLKAFAATKHIARDASKLVDLPDPLREAVGLPLGEEGEFYVGDNQDSMSPRATLSEDSGSAPWPWCDWLPLDDGSQIFVDSMLNVPADDWLEYLLENMFIPWGRNLNGLITSQGDDLEDHTALAIKDNQIHEYSITPDSLEASRQDAQTLQQIAATLQSSDSNSAKLEQVTQLLNEAGVSVGDSPSAVGLA